MSKMSDLHANTASDRADDAEREVARLRAVNAELLEACEEALHQLTPAQLVPMDGLDRTRMWLREAIAKAKA